MTGPRATGSQPDFDVDGGQPQSGPLRVIEGNPDHTVEPSSRGLWPAAVPDQAAPTGTVRGFGFCLPCHAEGKTTLAADPVNGAACDYHLRSA